MENEKKNPEKILSPTSIISYLRCPLQYYYQYICKLPLKKSIHLIKGTIIHKILENFFSSYREDFNAYIKKEFEKQWEENKVYINSLNLEKSELEKHKEDALNILKMFVHTFTLKVNNLVTIKANDKKHAFMYLKPKFKELSIKNEDIHLKGIIDNVNTNFSNDIIITDYKTSSRYGVGIPEEYRLQLNLYSLLYYKKFGICPNYASVVYLRYGEEVFFEITPPNIKHTLNILFDVWTKTRSTKEKDYSPRENNLCRWCSFFDICNGINKHEQMIRKEKLKSIFYNK